MLGEVCRPQGAGAIGRVGQQRAQGACTRTTRDCGGLWVQGTRGERTKNIQLMSVTPEVFQLEMFSLKFLNSVKSWLMSVTPETSQPAMGPYFFSVLAGSLSKASTAFSREPVLNFFVHLLHFFLLLAASTSVARRSEMRSMIMSFIVCALCVPARAKAMARDRTRARSRR